MLRRAASTQSQLITSLVLIVVVAFIVSGCDLETTPTKAEMRAERLSEAKALFRTMLSGQKYNMANPDVGEGLSGGKTYAAYDVLFHTKKAKEQELGEKRTIANADERDAEQIIDKVVLKNGAKAARPLFLLAYSSDPRSDVREYAWTSASRISLQSKLKSTLGGTYEKLITSSPPSGTANQEVHIARGSRVMLVGVDNMARDLNTGEQPPLFWVSLWNKSFNVQEHFDAEYPNIKQDMAKFSSEEDVKRFIQGLDYVFVLVKYPEQVPGLESVRQDPLVPYDRLPGSGDPVYKPNIRVRVVDLHSKTVIAERTFAGSSDKDVITTQGDEQPQLYDDVQKWLVTLL